MTEPGVESLLQHINMRRTLTHCMSLWVFVQLCINYGCDIFGKNLYYRSLIALVLPEPHGIIYIMVGRSVTHVSRLTVSIILWRLS